MARIRIQQFPEQSGNFHAKVSFNQGPAYNVILSDPFSKGEEERLEWYFEEHRNFPFTDQVKSEEAATSVIKYGERLFKQVFASEPHILTAYKTAVEAGLNTLQIEIVGQPSFHALHWEALKDPELPQPLALQATIVRKSGVSQEIPTTVNSSPTINLLIVVSRPLGRKDIGSRTISRPLVESLRQDKLPVKIDILRPGTYKALENHLRVMTEQHGVGYYHVVHFDVHGAIRSYPEIRAYLHERYGRGKLQPYEGMKAFLFLEGEKGNNLDPLLEGYLLFGKKGNNLDPLEATELAHLLRVHQIPIAILNACQSGKQVGDRETSLGSHLMQAGVQMVVAMGYSVTVRAAKLLMNTLYQHLFAKEGLAVAMRHGRTALYNHKTRWASLNQTIELEDWILPVVYQNQEYILQVRAFTPEESAAFVRREVTSYAPPQTRYGFIGRDLDILQIEKYLLTKRNIVLVQGMGGVGITTFLQHLGEWWQRTGFVKRVFYFAYDERALTREQILDTIARQLLSDLEYAHDFQLKPLASQENFLAQKLRSERHLLIFDNLEFITRAQLATREALQCLLVDLKDGQSLVLLGSRSKESWFTSESWLFNEALEEHVYHLEGLDREAVSELTSIVLERHNATKYREDPDLWHLIELLYGFPLALEVVLANLEQRTPTETLAALQTGSVDLDIHNSRERTKSILGSIDYSYSKLSPDAQQFLLCLAPFTSVVDVKVLKDYFDTLQHQPTLSTFTFEYWSEMLQEAVDWGLLVRPIPGLDRILLMQPTLPYFLRRRLDTPERTTMRDALKDAFRLSYQAYGETIFDLMKGRDRDRQVGVHIIATEYENLMTALKLALASQITVLSIYFALSEYLYNIHDMERAFALDQMVWKQLETYPREKRVGELGEEYIGVIGTIAERQLDLRHYEEADKTYHEILDLIEHLEHLDEIGRNGLKAKFYHQLGRLAQMQGQWSQAEKYYKQALQIKVDLDDRKGQAITYHQLGQLAEYQQQWAQAEAYYQPALLIFRDFKDASYFAATSFNLGLVALKQQHWQQAEAYYQQALWIYYDFNKPYMQAIAYQGLGNLAQEQQQWAQAEAYFKRVLAINIALEVPNMPLQAITYFNLGDMAQEQRHWEQAERYYQLALQIRIEYNDHYAQAIIDGQLGKIAQEQHHWVQAEENYQKALQIFIELNDRHRLALTYTNLGTIALKLHNWPQARTYYLTALKIAVEEKDDVSSKALLRTLTREWRGNSDTTVLTKVAEILGMKLDEARQMFAEILANGGW